MYFLILWIGPILFCESSPAHSKRTRPFVFCTLKQPEKDKTLLAFFTKWTRLDLVWPRLTWFDSVWPCLSWFDLVGLCLTRIDSAWPGLTLYYLVWLNMTCFKPSLTQFNSIWPSLTWFNLDYHVMLRYIFNYTLLYNIVLYYKLK